MTPKTRVDFNLHPTGLEEIFLPEGWKSNHDLYWNIHLAWEKKTMQCNGVRISNCMECYRVIWSVIENWYQRLYTSLEPQNMNEIHNSQGWWWKLLFTAGSFWGLFRVDFWLLHSVSVHTFQKIYLSCHRGEGLRQYVWGWAGEEISWWMIFRILLLVIECILGKIPAQNYNI